VWVVACVFFCGCLCIDWRASVCLLCCERVCAGCMSERVFFVVAYVWACLLFWFVVIVCCVCCMCCCAFDGVIDVCVVFGCVLCCVVCVCVCFECEVFICA